MFVEARLNDNLIIYATSGGPGYNTSVVSVSSGGEQRNSNWGSSRGKWNIGDRLCLLPELEEITRHFHVVEGKEHGFRFKNFADYAVDVSESALVFVTAGVYQLYKNYTFGGRTKTKKIQKPVNGVRIFLDGLQYLAATTDITTGLVTLPALKTATVSSVSVANRAVVTTAAAHTFVIGDSIAFPALTDAHGLLGSEFNVIDIPTPTSITIDADTTTLPAFGAVTGSIASYRASVQALAWAGEYDVPVRFDTDDLNSRFDAMQDDQSAHYLFALPVIEIRV